MPIKYGDLTIIHNESEINIFSTISLFFGYEITSTKESKLIFLFEDEEICEADDKIKKFKFTFFECSSSRLPSYFEKGGKHKEVYFKKTPTKKEDKLWIDFKPLFSPYKKYNTYIREASCYNGIYYCHKLCSKTEVFGILRIKSSETMPRFQFAYDSNEFTKEEVIYLINHIFKT
jgi:hypothetical protein